MSDIKIQSLFHKALAKQLNGESQAALILYRELLSREPLHGDSLHNLGVIHLIAGNCEEALDLFQKTLSVQPNHLDALNNIALTYKQMNNDRAAALAFEKALEINPRNGRIHFNLGNLLRETGREQDAVCHYRKAIELNPNDHEAYKNLGIAYLQLGLLPKARQACLHSLTLQAGQAGVYYNLGLIEMAAGDWTQAFTAFNAALQQDPYYADACLNLGTVCQKQGNPEQSAFWLQKALELQPHHADAYYNLGIVFEQTNNLQKELDNQYRALAACPDRVQTWIGAMRAFSKIADWPRLNMVYEKIIAYPFSAAEEALLATALYLFHAFPFPNAVLFEKHAQWGDYALQKYCKSNANLVFDFQALKASSSKIRIGYVSPDFCRHSVGWFFKTLIQGHDREHFEIYCYATDEKEDDLTREIAQNANCFRKIRDWNTRTFAEAIYRDRIQILVDLTGHTRNHRLDVFALRPAPIQVTAYGYPNGTGLATMDYRITDSLAEGPSAQTGYREKLVFLSRFFLPLGTLGYTPDSGTRSSWGLPEEGVLLVSFNRPGKLRPELLKLWDRILEQCPEAFLAIGCPNGRRSDLQANLLSCFSGTLTRSRVFFPERAKSEEEHRARYGLADLALDSYPYSGTTTSYEALYMNVPVITLAGVSHVQRTTYSLLKHLGLEETIAHSEQEYVEKTVALIRAPALLQALKTKLQKAMQKALAGRTDYVKELEQAYQIMWQRYQKGEPAGEIYFEKGQ